MIAGFIESISHLQTYMSPIKHSKDGRPNVKPGVESLHDMYPLSVLCSGVDLRKLTVREAFGLGSAVIRTDLQALSVTSEVVEDFSLALDYNSLDKICVCLPTFLSSISNSTNESQFYLKII